MHMSEFVFCQTQISMLTFSFRLRLNLSAPAKRSYQLHCNCYHTLEKKEVTQKKSDIGFFSVFGTVISTCVFFTFYLFSRDTHG